MTTTFAHRLLASVGRLRNDTSAVAMLEFGLLIPVFVTMCVGGVEIANYITTKMRVSQMALQIADNAARMGTGSQLAAKTISEGDINDVFIGGQIESGGLDLNTNGRVILTDLEPTSNPNANPATYKIGWRRCYGQKTNYARQYPVANGTTGLTGIGPTGRQATAQPDNATMFVEIYYVYRPVIKAAWAPTTTFTEIASMSVRDRRDLTGPPTPTPGVTPVTC